jgi:hypothetical protein
MVVVGAVCRADGTMDRGIGVHGGGSCR